MPLATGDVEITIHIESDAADVTLTSRPRDGADLRRLLPDLGRYVAEAHAASAERAIGDVLEGARRG